MSLIERHDIEGYAVGLWKDFENAYSVCLMRERNMGDSTQMLLLDTEETENRGRERLTEAVAWICSQEFYGLVDFDEGEIPDWDLIVEHYQTFVFEDRAGEAKRQEQDAQRALEALPTFGMF